MRTPFPTFLVLLASLLLLAAQAPASAAPPPAIAKIAPNARPVPNARTIRNLSGFPLAHLRFNLSPKLYKSLEVSPLTAWVVTEVSSLPGVEPKITHSEANGAFDKFALEVAHEWAMHDYDTTESRTHHPSLNVHLLIYKLADGNVMAVSFAHNDEAYYAGYQRTDVWVGVCKNGKWTTVAGTKHHRETGPY